VLIWILTLLHWFFSSENDGVHMHEGDIKLTALQKASLDFYGDPTISRSQLARGLTADPTKLWSTLVVPYNVSSELGRYTGSPQVWHEYLSKMLKMFPFCVALNYAKITISSTIHTQKRKQSKTKPEQQTNKQTKKGREWIMQYVPCSGNGFNYKSLLGASTMLDDYS